MEFQSRAGKTFIIRLDKFTFNLKNCSDDFYGTLARFISNSSTQDNDSTEIVEIDASNESDLRAICDKILEKFQNCVWIRASCLMTPSNKKVLIAARPGAGKSTLSVALSLKYHWRVISEDLAIFDLKQNRLLYVPFPFYLRIGGREILSKDCGLDLTDRCEGDWLSLDSAAYRAITDSRIDYAVMLGGWRPRPTIEKISSSDYMRHVFSFSNILRQPDSMSSLHALLNAAECFILFGGFVGRLELLVDHCK